MKKQQYLLSSLVTMINVLTYCQKAQDSAWYKKDAVKATYYLFILYITDSLVAHTVKNLSACNAGDPGSILGSGNSPGEGNGNLHQYSCLENPTDRGAWWATVYVVVK